MATIKKVFPVLAGLIIFAVVLGITTSCSNSPAPGKKIATGPSVSAELKKLLNEGPGITSDGYFHKTSTTLVAAAAGDDNPKFYDLGKLLVKDGLSHTIIDLGREMNGTWYEWSEHRAPPSQPDAFIRAWRQIVTAMRSVPGQHFKFLWTVFMDSAAVVEAWPGSAYVDYIGTDLFDWYGGPKATYPHTASGALDHENKWQQILTSAPGGLNWTAALSKATGSHVSPAPAASGPLLAGQGASSQNNTPETVNGMGELMGGRLQYTGVYLPDSQWPSASVDQPVLAPWQQAGYQMILSVPLVPLPPAIKSYSGPPEPGNKSYQLADYPDAVAALRQGA
jgi:hypothetical protein